jgi:hypothetical protein
MRFRNIEFRWSKVNNKYELVKWRQNTISETCYVIAFFDKDKEGYDMRTVGDRFFEDKDAWFVGKHALAFLNDMFNELQKEDEE